MDWWMWLASGLLLVVLELVTPSGFFIIFFGLSALTVGVLASTDLVVAWWAQWLLFTVLAIAYLSLFRGRLQARFERTPVREVDSMIGNLAVPKDVIAAGAVGAVEVRGAAWSARNVSVLPITLGQRCRVTGIEGLLLTVVPE